MRTLDTTPLPLADALTAGMRWLHTTAQPPQALLRHGIDLTTTTNRTLRFCPAGPSNRPLLVITPTHYTWRHNGTQLVPTQRLDPAEITEIARLLHRMGDKITRTWDGYPATTASLCLSRPAHPTLLAAAHRYQDGCPTHPDKGATCSCGWYEHGANFLVHPRAKNTPARRR